MPVFTRTNPQIDDLVSFSETLRDLMAISGLLAWDQETYLPHKGGLARAHQLETLSGIIHSKATSKKIGDLLSSLQDQIQNTPGNFTQHDTSLVALMSRDYNLAKKLPASLVQAISKQSSVGLEEWKHARNQNNFAVFAPALSRMVSLKKEVAHAYGFMDSPYDALLEEYEKDLRAKTVKTVFDELVVHLTPLIKDLRKKTATWDRNAFHQEFDEKQLWSVTMTLLAELGFDLEAGRQDQSTHPFTMGVATTDVRLTTRVLTNNPLSTILSSIHEGGHGMYEQGIAPEIARTRLGMADSLVIHESQSRFFENMIGKSSEFWEYFFPVLQTAFSTQLGKTTAHQAWQEVNVIRPSLIRVDADEVTYHLHIAIRAELEQRLIEDTLAVDDLSEAWNTLYKKYLDVDVPDDLHGVLQDIHWSQGLIGYFPTYSLGSFLSVQLSDQLHAEHPEFDSDVANGKFDVIKKWLGDKVHTGGSMATSGELSVKLTGKHVSAESFIKYVKKKFAL